MQFNLNWLKKIFKDEPQRLVLYFIFVLELGLGVVLFNYLFGDLSFKQQLLGVNEITRINKEKIQGDESSELKYFYELGPGEWEEQPDWLPYKVTYQINQDGFRESENYQIEKPNNTYRIIALGDSFTYGHHVNLQDVWTEQLEKKLNEDYESCSKSFEVINLGMPGYDVQYLVERYKRFGQKYDPDLILWFDSGMSFYRHVELTQPMIEDCYENSPQSQKEEDDAQYWKYSRCNTQVYENLEKTYEAKDLLETIYGHFAVFFDLENTKNTLVFYFENLRESDLKAYENLSQRHPTANFLPLIPKLEGQELLPDSHPSKEGHTVITEAIFEYLLDQQIGCL